MTNDFVISGLQKNIFDVLEAKQDSPTYAVQDMLRQKGILMSTAKVRYQLEKLEAQGLVERIGSVYVRQLCWRVVK